MRQTCPLSFEKIDNTKARIVSFLTLLLLLLFFQTHSVLIPFFLLIDLSTRLFFEKNYSVLYQLAVFMQKILVIKSSYKDSGAKQLAGYFGLLFLGLLSLFSLLYIPHGVTVVITIYAFCLLLDVIFDYCVGCQIYYIIKKFYPNFMS